MLVKFMSALSVVALLSGSAAMAAGKKNWKEDEKKCKEQAEHVWNKKTHKCEAKAAKAAAPETAAPEAGETAPVGE